MRVGRSVDSDALRVGDHCGGDGERGEKYSADCANEAHTLPVRSPRDGQQWWQWQLWRWRGGWRSWTVVRDPRMGARVIGRQAEGAEVRRAMRLRRLVRTAALHEGRCWLSFTH